MAAQAQRWKRIKGFLRRNAETQKLNYNTNKVGLSLIHQATKVKKWGKIRFDLPSKPICIHLTKNFEPCFRVRVTGPANLPVGSR